jgi:hypothetical protein
LEKQNILIDKDYKKPFGARCWWFTPIILATQEAEIRRTAVQSHLGKESVRPYLEKTCH